MGPNFPNILKFFSSCHPVSVPSWYAFLPASLNNLIRVHAWKGHLAQCGMMEPDLDEEDGRNYNSSLRGYWIVGGFKEDFPTGRAMSAWCMLSHVWLSPILWTVAHQASLSMGFFRQENEWIAISSSRWSFQPKDWTYISCVSCIAGRFLTHWITGEAQWVKNLPTILRGQ